MFKPEDIISVYTRAQAIEDGVLMDLTPMAQETGFNYPVACTGEVWHAITRNMQPGESERGRIHDLLFLLLCKIKIAGKGTDRLEFTGIFGRTVRRFLSICGPGDDAEPVITIKLQ